MPPGSRAPAPGGGLRRTEGEGTGKGSKVPPPVTVMLEFTYGRRYSLKQNAVMF